MSWTRLLSHPRLWTPLAAALVMFMLIPLSWVYRWIRRKDFLKEATRLGFVALPDDSPLLARETFDRVLQFNHRGVGFRPHGGIRLLNAVRGHVGGREIWLADFFIPGEGSWFFPQTAAAFRQEGKDFPLFLLRPFDIRYYAPGLETATNAGGKITLRTNEPEHPFMVRLKQVPLVHGPVRWAIEGGWDWLVLYHPISFIRTAALEKFISDASSMEQLLR